MNRKIRILIAKPGMDGHDKGALIVSSKLRDEGFEVIYTGLRKTAEQITSAAIQEDADVIGLSMLSGSHLALCKKVMDQIKKEGIEDKLVVLGGVIPDEDVDELKAMGINAVFTQSNSFDEMIDFIKENVNLA
jgi:methylmalonyl-CoA mutase C-terminal domain/subunit